MTGFAALGCNPEDTGASLDDIGAASLGTLAYSPKGIYIALQADGAITQGQLTLIQGNWQGKVEVVSVDGAPVCFPQVAVTDDHYFWGLVLGSGTGLAGEAITAGARLYAGSTAGDLVDTAGTRHLTGVSATAAAANNAQVPIAVVWPHVDLVQ